MKTYRSSLEKHNAPYRGVSSRFDYVNHRMAVTHDLLEIFNRSGGNPSIHGHKHINEDNLSAIINGDKDILTDKYTAGTIKRITKEQVDLSNLSKWSIPAMTYGKVQKTSDREWRLTPPSAEKGFFELEHTIRIKRGEKLLIRFKPKDWSPKTVYSFGALNFDSSGSNMKELKVDEFNNATKINNQYFEHILRFNEDRDIRLAIKTVNSSSGVLGVDDLIMEEFGVYYIEETDVSIKSLDQEIKPMINWNEALLSHLEKREK